MSDCIYDTTPCTNCSHIKAEYYQDQLRTLAEAVLEAHAHIVIHEDHCGTGAYKMECSCSTSKYQCPACQLAREIMGGDI